MVDHGEDRPEDEADGQAGPEADGDAAGGDAWGGERVAKALARAGVASRRDVERYISAGRVALNGRVLDTPAVKVGPGDVLTVDGEVVGEAEPARLWRHHKPPGLLTSHGDPQGRPTVFEHLPEGLPRVISIGRLDLASEGLLLLTNDGELARSLELPDTGWKRTYRARAWGRADPAKLERLKAGATVDGVRYGPIEARLDKASGAGAVGRGRVSDAPANLWITVTVTEGKNREVRRVLESLGLKVNRLIRLAYGPFALGTLAPGEVEEVGPRVLREQLDGLIAPERLPRGDRRPGPVLRGRMAAPAAAAPPPRSSPALARTAAKPDGGFAAPRPARTGERPPPKGATGAKRLTFGESRFKDPARGPRSDRPTDPTIPASQRETRGAPAKAGAGPRGPRPPAGKGQGGWSKPGAGASPGAGRGPFAGPRAKPGAKPGGKPVAAAAKDAKRTGMELTPPMRRAPRRKPGPPAPRRPRD